MTDFGKHTNRIPQELLNSDEPVSAWQLPVMGEQQRIVKSAQREAKEKQAKAQAAKEQVQEEAVVPQPPTAEELQAIADQAQQEGYADGFKEGMEKGMKQGEAKGLELGEQKAYNETRADLDDQRQRLAAIADQLFVPMQNQDREIEKSLIDIVLALTRHLLGSELSSSPEKLIGVIHQALAALPVGAKNISVVVNDQDLELLETVKTLAQRDWVLKGDAELERGGCRVETAESFIDYSIETRLKHYLSEADAKKTTKNADHSNPEPIDSTAADDGEKT